MAVEFIHWECPDCGYDHVLKLGAHAPHCALCAEDNGHDIRMRCRAAVAGDKPEGRDERKAP